MDDLTPRQIQILRSIIEEYIQAAGPVGSEVLEKKYNLGISPATIRNEMVTLTTGGYLKQPHTSAGRVPTPKGMKFYIDQLMEERKLTVSEEVAAKERVLSAKDDFDHLMHEATHGLADSCHAIGIAATEGGNVWHAGYANILNIPEFFNIDVTSEVLGLLDEVKRVQELFFRRVDWDEPVEIVFGEELGWPKFDTVGIVATSITTPEGKGTIGVIGAARFDYPLVIPFVRYYGNLISDLMKT